MPRQRGFTLFEVIVAIAIMGILMSIVLPFLPGDKQELLYEELDRFEARVAYAQAHAVLQSQDLGFAVEDREYRFLQRTQSGWEPIQDEPLQPQKIPQFLQQKLLIEGVEVVVEEPLDDEPPTPKILFFSSGEVTPFTYRLALSENNYTTLEYDPLGEVKRNEFREAK
ncbi:MAG: type II secretion system protein GspH [Proteobacteria bacterium]|nr:MAG: type II secretion system protein GspH [Pseudomonadota bacterium]